jgi:hypothetical protein
LEVSRPALFERVHTGRWRPPLPTRLVAGLLILKHMHSLSDEALCARRLENPYYQFFCGELGFCRRLPFDRSLLTYWRQRLGEDELAALEQESLAAAQEQGAGEPRSRTGGDRHDRAAQGDCPPDRCAALPPGLGSWSI